jgi:glucose/arabinose dehydrogenase
MPRFATLALLLVVLGGCAVDGRAEDPNATHPATTGTSVATGTSPTSNAGTGDLVDIGAGLQGPVGATASVLATGIPNVAALAIDGRGRVWAASAAYSDAGADAVYLIAATGAAPTPVIGDLHTVLGLLWVGDTLYVASAGRVDAYSGLTAATFASHRTVITFPDGIGEVNGLTLAPDGRVLLGISAPCNACTVTLKGSGSVVSFAPDGSDLQVVASGIRAPVGLAVLPGTSDLFVTMNQRDDLAASTPGDWLAVVAPGQDWGFPDCYGQDSPSCEGVPTPAAVLDPHAAVSGVALVPDGIGGANGPVAIVAEWALSRVQLVRLSRVGSTWSGTVDAFLTGIAKPVAVVIGPDGAVVVGDWGSGTIYRIVLGAGSG